MAGTTGPWTTELVAPALTTTSSWGWNHLGVTWIMQKTLKDYTTKELLDELRSRKEELELLQRIELPPPEKEEK